MRDSRSHPQPPHLFGLVVLEVGHEPLDVAVARKGEYADGDAVEGASVHRLFCEQDDVLTIAIRDSLAVSTDD